MTTLQGIIDKERGRALGHPRRPFCPACQNQGIRNGQWDAYYCPACSVWLEGGCDSATCPFRCHERPDEPPCLKGDWQKALDRFLHQKKNAILRNQDNGPYLAGEISPPTPFKYQNLLAQVPEKADIDNPLDWISRPDVNGLWILSTYQEGYSWALGWQREICSGCAVYHHTKTMEEAVEDILEELSTGRAVT